ncbi:MAG TPA: DoxX family protein [Planctomycetaceae bacterium]|nr:DoxX family protein [Planctomycetaceae bacterium]
MQCTAAVLGRLLISPIFIVSAVHKLMNWEQTVGHLAVELKASLASVGMQDSLGRLLAEPVPAVLLGIAAAVELLGGLMVLFGAKARLGAFALVLFLIPTTLVFHDFWTFSGEEQMNEMQHCMKNVTIMGGLLMIVALGPGRCSFDGRRKPPVPTR